MASPNSHSSQQFYSTASKLGLGVTSVFYRDDPERLVAELLAQLKTAAKYLSRAAGVPRSKAHEGLARAGGFSNWHHLSKHFDSASTASADLPSEWFDSLAPLLPLNAAVPRELPPAAACQVLLEQLWSSVANELQVAPHLVLDNVGAQMLGERSWNGLLARTPLTASEPLYTFRIIESEGAGSFRASDACHALNEELDDYCQEFGEMSRAELKRARKWVEGLLARRPDFLDAGLVLAQMKADANEEGAADFLDGYLARAEGLIPKDFKGKVSWYEIGNRLYHRMLYLRMALYHRRGATALAARVARKMLRLNPSDNLGVRNALPLMLLSGDEYPAALQACKYMSKEPECDGVAIRSFVAFAMGDVLRFRSELLASLFRWPALRAFLENTDATMPQEESGHRGVIPDYEFFEEFARPAFLSVPGLKEAALSLIRDQTVIDAETRLRNLWEEIGGGRNSIGSVTGRWNQWESERNRYVAELAGTS